MVIFALQNNDVVTVTFFNGQIEGSLAFILLMVALMGILIACLMFLPGSISSYFRYRKLKKINARLEDDLIKQKELTHFAKKTPPTQDAIAKIEQGAIDDGTI